MVLNDVDRSHGRRPEDDTISCELCGRSMHREHAVLVDWEDGTSEPGEEVWIWVCSSCSAELERRKRVPELIEAEGEVVQESNSLPARG